MAKATKGAKTAPTIIIGTRFTPPEKTALDKAAKEDDRPLSSLVHKIVTEWLKSQGFLK